MRTNIDTQQILDLNRRFHDEVEAESYDQRMGVDHGEAARAAIVAELELVLGKPLPRGCTVVDVASGTGNLAVKLAATGWFKEVIAVDISARSLEVAKSAATAMGVSLTTVVSDMVRLPFEDNSVDFVVGCAFLHHLPDPVGFMAEVHRVLKPGSSFVIVGEPTSFGASAINVMKFPLVLTNRILRRARGRADGGFVWDHDSIDVHDFTQADARALLAKFEDGRIVTEGFAAPIFDQALATPVRHVAGSNKALAAALSGVTKGLGWSDRHLFNRVLPKGGKVSLKISGRKAA